MRTLREAIESAKKAGAALGHFNISDSNQLKALASASRETGLPVIVGLSEGERDYFPLSHAKALVERYRADGLELYLNADHTYSIEKVRAAIESGVDSIIFDGAKGEMAENIAKTKEAVAIARASDRDVIAEAELGYIGQSSKVLTELPEGAALTEEMETSVADAVKFVGETGIDCFAPAVGNVHGMLGVAKDPPLNIQRISEIAAAVPARLVLHGASGNSEADIRAAIKAGVCIVHINTEFRVAYKTGLAKGLAGEEVAPYKFLAPALEEMKALIVQKLKLFAGR
ncbi:MAG: class II fructose-bisphosphate aldolase [Candidatus Kaiserbacteria bacterium]|nr:class II fructose-bisphosphate aldolase [Candidatus Kaiserbacteria bacterium]